MSMDLSSHDDAYDLAEPKMGGEFDRVPDGTYQARIDKVYIEPNQARTMPVLKWEFVVLAGEHEGSRVKKFSGLPKDPEILGWVKGDLAKCGLKLERFSHLPARLKELLDIPVEIYVQTKPDKDGKPRQNVYINSRWNPVDSEQAGRNYQAPPPEDDVPF